MITALDQRSRTILKMIVDAYVETGEPVGSRTLAHRMGMGLSPATIRNVMADLEDTGLLHAPHTSAGRVPTEAGLRLFVDGILEIGDLGAEEKTNIESRCHASGKNLPEVLEHATATLAGLSSCAGLVIAPKTDQNLKQIEFVQLGPGRVLVILVTDNGLVENRIIDAPLGLPASSLTIAANFINARLDGRSLGDVRGHVLKEIETQRHEIDELTAKLVQSGLAIWSDSGGGQLIVKGQSRLLDDVTALEDLERVRKLFEALETRESMLRLLEATGQAEGVQIFIGAENGLFANTGCTAIVAPYMNRSEKIVGAIGVIGPTRLNYARIIPMVDYTAKMIGRLLR